MPQEELAINVSQQGTSESPIEKGSKKHLTKAQ